MSDPMKELDNALGILSDVETIKEEPWNYVHKPAFKMPAQELVNNGQASPVVDMSQDIDNDYKTNCICKNDFCNHSRFPLPIQTKPPIQCSAIFVRNNPRVFSTIIICLNNNFKINKV